MPKYLVIIESPGKRKSISSYLGKDYKVIATYGHIRDLPDKKMGIDIRKDFEPTYEVYPDKKDLIKSMVKDAQNSDIVYIMTDLDREGEGIAKHIADVLPENTTVKRAKSNAIKKQAILDAIENSGDIDFALVDSYECRRLLDRLVGYKCSYVTKQATGGSSAGRVQSAALRILAEREKEIRNFVPEEYWPIEVELLTEKDEKVLASIKKPDKMEIKNGEQAQKICDNLKNNKVNVSKYEVKEVDVKPYAPFTTSTLYQAAASILGWNSKKTAQVAQRLYENSLCTYIRSDSVYIVPEVVSEIREMVDRDYGNNYLPKSPNVFSSKKNAQEAHEAIRATDINVKTTSGTDDNKLYKIIWKRTVSSQMSPMKQRRISSEFQCKDYILSASGSKVLFEGWRKVWDYGELSDQELPEMKVGDPMKVIDVITEQKFTTPPPYFNDRTIIKELEKRGIGRPSTYASIIETLKNRKYTENNKKQIRVTDMGIRVSDFLIESNFCFVDLYFTKEMEETLDEIAQQKAEKVKTLKEFWKRLKDDIDNAKSVRNEKSQSDYDCPECGGKLLKKYSRFGPFYSCENYKSGCKYKCNIGENGEPVEQEKKEIEYSEFKCPKCKAKMVKRTGKYGEFLGCSKYSSGCRGMRTSDGEEIKPKRKKKKTEC